MSPRTGRPTSNPKSNYVGIRLSDEEVEKLRLCEEKTGLTKTDIIRKGIDYVYQNSIKK